MSTCWRRGISPRTSSTFARCVVVLAEHADRLGVVEDVAGVLRRAVRVDRRADRADRAEREVEERPLDPARAEDRERVALADAEREQPVRVALDALVRLGPRDRAPVVSVLDRGTPAFGRPAAIASRHSRSIVRFSLTSPHSMAEGTLWGRANRFGPSRFEGEHAHDLERLDQLRTRLDPRGARPGDEACRALVGHLLPDAAPRVRHADQAEALLPGARARPRARRDRQGLGGREGPVRARRGRGARGADARSDDSRSIEIARFVDASQVDPIFFDRTYFLVPAQAPARGGRTCCC